MRVCAREESHSGALEHGKPDEKLQDRIAIHRHGAASQQARQLQQMLHSGPLKYQRSRLRLWRKWSTRWQVEGR